MTIEPRVHGHGHRWRRGGHSHWSQQRQHNQVDVNGWDTELADKASGWPRKIEGIAEEVAVPHNTPSLMMSMIQLGCGTFLYLHWRKGTWRIGITKFTPET